MNCGIYCIKNNVNGKMYIGQSIEIETRWKKHSSQLKNNNHPCSPLQNAWNKYGGENFTFHIVVLCEDHELNKLEIYYTSFFNTYIHNECSNGYNLTIGGDGSCGYKHSEESKKKMSVSKVGMYVGENNPQYGKRGSDATCYMRRGELHPMYGKKHTDETKAKIGRAGASHPNAKVIICDNKEFGCLKELAEYTHVSLLTLYGWMSKKVIPQEYIDRGLRYKDEAILIYTPVTTTSEYNKMYKSKKVLCEGIVFSSLRECSDYYGVNYSTMSDWLNPKRKTKMRKDFIEKGLMYI